MQKKKDSMFHDDMHEIAAASISPSKRDKHALHAKVAQHAEKVATNLISGASEP